MFAIACLLLCAAAVVGVECALEKRHVVQDLLTDMYAQQEVLLKSIEKIVVEKFAKLNTEIASIRQEMNIIDVKMSNFESNFNSKIDKTTKEINSLKQNMDADHKYLKTIICPIGYTSNEFGCYKLVLEEVNWDTAMSRCQADGAHLVSLDSSEQLQKLAVLMKNKQAPVNKWYRIGGRRLSGQWSWVNGNRSFTYTNWYPNRPNVAGDCVEMGYIPGSSNHLKWDNYDCTTSKEYFICEI